MSHYKILKDFHLCGYTDGHTYSSVQEAPCSLNTPGFLFRAHKYPPLPLSSATSINCPCSHVISRILVFIQPSYLRLDSFREISRCGMTSIEEDVCGISIKFVPFPKTGSFYTVWGKEFVINLFGVELIKNLLRNLLYRSNLPPIIVPHKGKK